MQCPFETHDRKCLGCVDRRVHAMWDGRAGKTCSIDMCIDMSVDLRYRHADGYVYRHVVPASAAALAVDLLLALLSASSVAFLIL